MPSTLKKPLRFSLDAETPENVYHCIQEVMAERSIPMKILANPLRVLVCRANRTPQIDRTLCLIGRDKVLARIAEGLA